MDYKPQTMNETEMNDRLDELLQSARAILNSIEETKSETSSVLEQISTRVNELAESIETDFANLDNAEKEAEEAFDELLVSVAAEDNRLGE